MKYVSSASKDFSTVCERFSFNTLNPISYSTDIFNASSILSKGLTFLSIMCLQNEGSVRDVFLAMKSITRNLKVSVLIQISSGSDENYMVLLSQYF